MDAASAPAWTPCTTLHYDSTPTVRHRGLHPVAIQPTQHQPTADCHCVRASLRGRRLPLATPLTGDSAAFVPHYAEPPATHHSNRPPRNAHQTTTLRSRRRLFPQSRSVPLPLRSTPTFVPLFGDSLRSATQPAPALTDCSGHYAMPVRIGSRCSLTPQCRTASLHTTGISQLGSRNLRTMSHYAEYCVVSLADGYALCRHNGHCVAAFPPSFDSPERSGYRRGNTAMPSLRSARSFLTRGLQLVSPRPRPGTCTDYLFTVAGIRSTPHLFARSSRRPPIKGPSPRLPARLAPRFRSLRVARKRACSARALRASALRRPCAVPFQTYSPATRVHRVPPA